MLRSPLARLEDEIHDCEARVRLHDTRLLHSLQLLREGTVRAASGKVLLAGGALLGGALGWWWTSRRTQPARHRAAARRRHHRARASDQLRQWAPLLLPLLTPLLDRKVAMALYRLGLPVNVRPVDPLPTVPALDLKRFSGRWYEIARLPTRREPACRGDVTLEYQPHPDGGLHVRRSCVLEDGRREQAEGRLRVPDSRQPGQAELSFKPEFVHWWPGAWADHWVLFIDQDYQAALVGTPERDRLWVLSRQPALEEADFEALKSLALRYGFDSTRLVRQPQSLPERPPE